MRPLNESYSPYQFAAFRVALGAYLAVHFAYLAPYAAEVFSDSGMLPATAVNPTFAVGFPNILAAAGPGLATWFVAALAVLSLAFAAGVFRQIVALILWYGLACLFNRNNLIANPSLPYVGWLLLATALIPSGELWEAKPLRRADGAPRDFRMPEPIFYGAWLLLAVGYLASGVAKLRSPSWQDGMAIAHVLGNPLARDTALRKILLSVPLPLLKATTWTTLALELLFLPLCLFRKGRAFAWTALIVLHLAILTIVDFADLTFGMLLIHFFVFDPRWFPGRASDAAPAIVFFDGVCHLCDRLVDFLLRVDRRGVLRVAALQGETARRLLAPSELPKPGESPRSVLLLDELGVHRESSGALRILSGLGGFWGLLGLARFVPRPFRDAVYRVIARNRYRWFGKSETCRLPTAAERERFLP